ncbi:MAG: hypothetical protein ACOYOK_07295 [Pseudobdellovibrionaceae bacterium]
MIDLLRFFLFKRFLKRNDLWPQNIQIGRLGRFFVVTCYDTSNSQAYIQRSACTGMSPHPLIANMKALSEWLERKVIQSQSTKDNPWSLFGSEGCAAMPTFLRLNSSSEHMAQERSICEAIERFVWTAWWTLSSKADVCLASEDSIFTEMNNEFKY